MIPRILHITPTFNYTCGRSYYHFITFKHLKLLGCYNYLFSKEGIALERLKSLKIDYSINKEIGSIKPFTIYGLLKQIHSIVKENRINIIHTYSRATEFLCLFYKTVYNSKILTINTVLSLVDKRYFVEYQSDKIIAISKCVESQLINKFKIPKSRIKLIYNYAEPYDVQSHRRYQKGNIFKILSVGRYHHEKNFETLLKSIKYMNNPNILLTLIGSGDLKYSYQKYIKDNNLNVVLISPQNDLTDYFLDSDICVLPSLVDPLPTFMVQSGFYKKPFIGSNVDGIRETIIDGYNGLMFNKGNSIELADKIMKYYQNSSLMEECAKNLHALVHKRHIPVDNVKKIFELYNSLLIK